MMSCKSLLINLTPYGLIKLFDRAQPYVGFCSSGLMNGLERYQILKKNKTYKNIHEGQRCFIVGNAPSINELDLSLLCGETVFSVSSGYHHPLYGTYKPKYHCLPQLTYTHLFTEQVAIEWFKEMHEALGDAELFLSTWEYDLVRRHGLFPGRRVNYVALRKDMLVGKVHIDLSGLIYRVQSVPVMALQIALFMGFKEIYIIGCDHDNLRTGVYHYFYEPTVLKNKDASVDPKGGAMSFSQDLHSLSILFQQYSRMKEMAKSLGCHIVNASPTGNLDIFDRVPFQDIWK